MVEHINTRYIPQNTDLLVRYHLVPNKGGTIYQACEAVASNAKCKGAAPTVYKINRREYSADIAFPIECIEMGNTRHLIDILTYAQPMLATLQVLSIKMPSRFDSHWRGPAHGWFGVREMIGIQRRPLVGIQLPSDVTASEAAKLASQAWTGRADIVIEHPLTPSYQIGERWKAVKETLKKFEADKLYIPQINGSIHQITNVAKEMKGTKSVAANSLFHIESMRSESRTILSRVRPDPTFSECALGILERISGADIIRAREMEKTEWGKIKEPLSFSKVTPIDVPAVMSKTGENVLLISDGSHPAGIQSAARALKQAIEATMTNVPLAQYAKVHKELRLIL